MYILVLPKNADFLQKNSDISKIKKALKGIFSETTCGCVLMYQFSIINNNRIIITSFRQWWGQGVILPKNKPLKSPPRLGLIKLLLLMAKSR